MIIRNALNIDPEHPAFAGHFPGAPIVPGVVLLDEALHAIAGATGVSLDACELRSVKFLSPLTPGVTVELVSEVQASGAIRFEILAGQRKIATGSVMTGKTA
jgi:3-hydroxymyristoyl/3-hydroxydecanoyl-(acyl carrier protein) dehydratase